MTNIAVLGAGVTGLSSALRILQLIPDAQLTVLSDKFTTDTTSHGVAGIFRPTLSKTPGVPIDLLKMWLTSSWKHYDSLIHSSDASVAGVQMISGYQFVNKPHLNELEKEFVYEYRPLSNRELEMFPGTRFKFGWFVTTVTVECSKYLKYLSDKIESRGGKIINCGHLSSLEELLHQYDIVVNCTGLGSRDLLKDNRLVANRGYLIKVKAPWLKHFIYTGDDGLSYIIPGHDVVHIGATRADNDAESDVRPEERARIMSDAFKVVPSLQSAPVVGEFVGWRPHREPVRVETELIKFPSGTMQVVHNYGHGAEGVTLSWGTACHAARLVHDLIRTKTTAKL